MSAQFFWVHIKKSAGQSIRKILHPYYAVTDRSKPCCFIGLSKKYWNDNLNNYRIPLGDYQLRRCQFASQFLYPNTWHQKISFVIAREPVARASSMFRYLSHEIREYARSSGHQALEASQLFDLFLEMVSMQRNPHSSDWPFGLRFGTHVNKMWNDITDDDGAALVRYIFRLEDLARGIDMVMAQCELPPVGREVLETRVNRTARTGKVGAYMPNERQVLKINSLYEEDFVLYHDLAHSF